MSSEAQAAGGLRAWAGVALVVLVAFGVAWGLQLRRESRERELVLALRTLAQGGALQMLSGRDCVDCDKARKWFESEQIRLQVCSVETDADCAERYRSARLKHLPAFVVHGQTLIKGWDLAEIKRALETQP